MEKHASRFELAQLRTQVHVREKHRQGQSIRKPETKTPALYKKCRGALSSGEQAWCERVLHGVENCEFPPDDFLYNRRSIRQWKTQRVSTENILAILEAARWAPSSCNRQPIEVVVIMKPQTITEVAKIKRQPFIAHAPCLLAITTAFDSYHHDKEYFGLLDTGAAIQNMLLAAHRLLLGACWINVAPQESGHKEIQELVRVPHGVRVTSLIALGHPDIQPHPPGRKLMSLKLEHYG